MSTYDSFGAMFPCPSKVPPSEFLNLWFYGLLRLFAFSHTYLWFPATEVTKESNIAVHAAMFRAMPAAFLRVQAVRSIAWRSDQTAKNCFLTPPPPLQPQHLLKYYTMHFIHSEKYQDVASVFCNSWVVASLEMLLCDPAAATNPTLPLMYSACECGYVRSIDGHKRLAQQLRASGVCHQKS